MNDLTTITLGGVTLTRPTDTNKRITCLLWGDAGCGKTTLAATAPGRKLWFNFDPDGTNTLAGINEDISIFDLSATSTNITEQFKNEGNPLNIKAYMDEFDTFIFDSLTNITDKTLTQGIKTNKGASIERPSPAAYATRNALAIRLVKNVMAATSKAKKHVIFTAHEGAPNTEEDTGLVLFITLALGGKLPANVGIDFSEIWTMYQVDSRNERRIAVRPSRKRKPMKTRMFQQTEPEFTWSFNADHWDAASNTQYRLDTWFNLWNTRNQKLPLPGTKEFKELLT
jgi:hypothetical protein